MYILRHFI